jgi:dTDP-4-dehydrorhamnose 3,5-epimerase
MKFTETKLPGAYLIELEPRRDERGYFARAWCAEEFGALGLNTQIAQINVGHSLRQGTVRGMHLQRPPHAEVKLVRCTRGVVFDVMVDLRADSPTCGQWAGYELSPDNGRMLYIPEGFAHGYQTLTDEAEICYQTSRAYAAAAATGVRYNDPKFGIDWPLDVSTISDADQHWPDFVQP